MTNNTNISNQTLYLMLKALLVNQPQTLVASIHAAAIGRNRGGAYLSLFARGGKYRFVGVYEEDWSSLPSTIVSQGKNLLPKTVVEDTVYNRDQAQRLELLFTVNPPFEAIRTRYAQGETDWIFLGVSNIQNNPLSEQDSLQKLPKHAPLFTSRADALRWALEKKAYKTTEEAETAYISLYRREQPATQEAMYAAWIQHIESVITNAR